MSCRTYETWNIAILLMAIFFLVPAGIKANTGLDQDQTKKTKADSSDTFYGVPVEFVQDLKKRTFTYFWEVVDSATWQTDDRHPAVVLLNRHHPASLKDHFTGCGYIDNGNATGNGFGAWHRVGDGE